MRSNAYINLMIDGFLSIRSLKRWNWNEKICQLIFRINSEIFIKYVQYFVICLRKWIFWSRQILIFLKFKFIFYYPESLYKMNFATILGAGPPDPLRGQVIAFKWPGRTPAKNPSDATAFVYQSPNYFSYSRVTLI